MSAAPMPDMSTLSPATAALLRRTIEKRSASGLGVEFFRDGRPPWLAYASSEAVRDSWIAAERSAGRPCNIVLP